MNNGSNLLNQWKLHESLWSVHRVFRHSGALNMFQFSLYILFSLASMLQMNPLTLMNFPVPKSFKHFSQKAFNYPQCIQLIVIINQSSSPQSVYLNCTPSSFFKPKLSTGYPEQFKNNPLISSYLPTTKYQLRQCKS